MFWCFIPYSKSLSTKLVRSRWLDIGLILFCVFMDLDFVSINTQKKNLADIQPSWPHARSITYFMKSSTLDSILSPGCVDIYISQTFLPPTENSLLKCVLWSKLRLANLRNCKVSLLLRLSVLGYSGGIMKWRNSTHYPRDNVYQQEALTFTFRINSWFPPKIVNPAILCSDLRLGNRRTSLVLLLVCLIPLSLNHILCSPLRSLRGWHD